MIFPMPPQLQYFEGAEGGLACSLTAYTAGKLRSITITLLTVRSIPGLLSATGLAHRLVWLRAVINM
jgi:hypothetical protein